ncbi:MAG: hypothetical protein SFV15_01555 [Polyangiaceae bacterium]|nr:hypothetical protein [Polyangiaceae bacterium]
MIKRPWKLLTVAVVGGLGIAAACNKTKNQCVTEDGLDCATGLPVDYGPNAAAGAGNTGLGGGSNLGSGGGVSIPKGAGLGQPCSATDVCRNGLACNATSTCEAGKSTVEGQPCLTSGECADGLRCSVPLAAALQNPLTAPTCVATGTGALGEGCKVDLECGAGLRCALKGFSAQCVAEGTKDVGGDCTTATDCLSGLTCNGGKCAPAGPVPFPLEGTPGVTCEDPSPDTARAYFEVPGATAPKGQEGDFFRLPFPNDIRVKDGKLDLSGFPTPGSALLGFDPVKIYVDALQATEGTWSGASTIMFRFSGQVDFNSIVPHIMDLTDPNGGYPGLVYGVDPNKNEYVCHNAYTVRIGGDYPLTPGHSYAVYLTGKDGATPPKAKGGATIERSAHLDALLSDTAPADAALAAAYPKYAAFRAALKTANVATKDVYNATVYTVGTPATSMKSLADAVYADPVPTVKGAWVKCEANTVSPCPQHDGGRGCGAPNDTFDEYHALVTLPIFQKGTAPYLTPADGGDISLTRVRTEDVCMAVTIPKGTAPADGWPLVVFGHGTGGSFRSFIRPEVNGALSSVAIGANNVGFAVLGIDLPQHGPRRGASTESPDNLFFNFANPGAARGNPMQGAADLLSVGRFAAALDGTVTSTPLKVNKDKIVLFGHSQGSTHGSLALPFSKEFKAGVLSGNGASLMHALLNKTKPVNLAAALPVVLGHKLNFASPGLPMGTTHPVLTLLQHWIDPADPLNFGPLLAKPETPADAKHVFLTYGHGDNYSPPITIALFARTSSALEVPADDSVMTPDALEVCSMAAQCPKDHTIDVKQYAPPMGKDGHFVVFDVAHANTDAVKFLAQAALGQVPTVPAP